MITTEMTVPFTIAHAGSDTLTTNWVYVHGYTKMVVSALWDAAITANVGLEGTDVAVAHGGDFQPDPAASEVYTVDTFTNISPAGTISNSHDTYDNVLPTWVRVTSTATTATAGNLTGHLVFKSHS